MEEKIKFSIIIPVYNVEKYLPKCIDSILEQEYTQLEVLLINDGSTDESGTICDEYVRKDNRIKVVHQLNQGAAAARNTGIDMADGEYIIFLDGDDYWYNRKVLNLINSRLGISHAEVLTFNYVKVMTDMSEKLYFKKSDSMPLEKLASDSLDYHIENDLWIACAWNKAIKRTLFNRWDLYFNTGVTSEDIDWSLRLALFARKFDYIKDIVVGYRQRQSSVSKSVNFKKMKILIANIDLCLSLLEKENDIKKVNLMKTYVGYQYGTAIFLLSFLNKREKKKLMEWFEKKLYLIEWSQSPKVKILRIMIGVGGIRFVIFALGILNKKYIN